MQSLILTLQLILCSFTPLPSWAQVTTAEINSATTQDQALKTPAGKFIQDLGDDALRIIKDKNLTQQEHADKYHQLLRDAFDLKTIAHFVIGRAWNSAPSEQRQEYMKLFEELVVKIYGERIEMYSGESFHVKSVRQESEEDIIVNSKVDHPGGAKPTTIDWRVRHRDGKLAIIDVIIEGISQSVTQREEYSSIIQRDNGRLDELLSVMRQRLREMNTGNSDT